jgi:hypothetical protein
MATLEEYIEKHNIMVNKLEILYEKYKFNDIQEHLKNIRGNLDYNKTKFMETQKNNCFNYLNFFQMYTDVMNHESDFVLFSIKDNPVESNIGKGVNPYIVSQGGYRWIKLISKSVEIINNSLDPDYYDDYSIIDEVENFIDDVSNSCYLPFNEKPELVIIFYESPNEEVIKTIENMNVSAISINDINHKLKKCTKYQESIQKIDTVNIDVNIIVTLCSELSNMEKTDTITIPLEILSKCITGNVTTLEEIIDNKNFIVENIKKFKRRIICQSAYDKLMQFVTVLSDKKNFGKEIARMKIIFDEYNIEVVQDKITERINNIKHPNKLANCVFGSGDYYNAITISGFASFINFARQNRVNIATIPCYSVEFSEKYLAQFKN